MNLRHIKVNWAIGLGVIGATVTFLLILAHQLTGGDTVFFLLHRFCYVAFVVGVKLFQSEREMPTQTQAILFDLFIVSLTALQWFVVGALVDWLRSKKLSRQRS